MTAYRFHAEARKEYAEASLFYEKRRQGLGARFSEEVEAAIQRILDWPSAWPIVDHVHGVRRCLARKFPYGILYRIDNDAIYIVAVMHCSRRPAYWASRLKEDGPQS